MIHPEINRKLDQAPQNLVERSLSIEVLRLNVVNITAKGARKAFIIKEKIHQGGKLELSEAEHEALKVRIDNAVVSVYEIRLNAAPYTSYVYCEGGKEEAKYGKKAKVRVIRGHHGPAHLRIDDEHFDVAVVIDPVEGTRPTAANEVGGTSFFVGSNGGQLREIPSEKDARYFDRITGPARLKGYISIANTPTENVGVACGMYGISADKVTVVVLKRDRNQALIDELRSAGANVKLIPECDFMPAFLSLYSDKPILSYGAGGKEEGWAAAMLAKKFGGAFDGRLVDKDGNALEKFPQILTPDDIVTGMPEDIFASVSSITGDNWFGMGPVIAEQKASGKTLYHIETISVGEGPLQRQIITV